MANTFDEIVRAYTDIHVGLAPTAAMRDGFRMLTCLITI